MSERQLGHRDRAIAHLPLIVGALQADLEPALDRHFRQCAILVHATDLALVGANPRAGDSMSDLAAERDTFAVMSACAMCDGSGLRAREIGIPAWRRVGGGVPGVVNRQWGTGTDSPRADPTGNSLRGLEIFRRLADDLGLHAFDCTDVGSSS